jgi:hypothetical protein
MSILDEREDRVRLVDRIDFLPLEILDQLDRQDLLPAFSSSFFDSKKRFYATQTGMAAQERAEELFAVADVATEVEVERLLYQRWFRSRRHPLSGSKGSVTRLVHRRMEEEYHQEELMARIIVIKIIDKAQLK